MLRFRGRPGRLDLSIIRQADVELPVISGG